MNPTWLDTLVNLPPTVDVLVKATMVLALGWLVHFALRRRNPRWRVMLWRGVALGLVVLPLLGFLLPDLDLAVVPAPEETPAVDVGFDRLPMGYGGLASPVYYGGYAAVSSPTAVPQPPSRPPLTAVIAEWIQGHPGRLAVLLWSMVALVLTAIALGAWFRLARLVRKARPAPAPARESMRKIAGDLGCRRPVDLRYTTEIVSPLLTGLRKPVVLLPKRAVRAERFEDLSAILVHELSHLKSHDLLWARVLQVLTVCLWFHPLAWRIRGAHASACEEVSDAVAADYVGDTTAYSATLARVALALTGRPHVLGGIPMARRPHIRERLELLKRKIRALPIRRRWVLLSVASGMVGLAVLGGLKLTYAQDSDPTQPSARVLRFPKHRFMGHIYIRDADDPREDGYLREGGFDRYWESFADAQGDVSIPAGKQVYLHIFKPVNLADLSPLDALRPDDVSMLSIHCDRTSVRADTAVMPYVGRLTGLKALDLRHVSLTARGARYLLGLKSLTHLRIMTEDQLRNAMAPSRQLADDCLPIIAGMDSLEVLKLSSTGITDAGLGALARMKSLRDLQIWSNRLHGPGVARLAGLASLRSLGVGGMAINDSSMRYLTGLTQLKKLDLGGAPVTDAGLVPLSGLTGLEDLNLYSTHVTEKGMVHLQSLTSLKRLKLGKGPGNPTKVGEGALLPLKNIKTFEYLDCSHVALTDADLACLAGCTKLRVFRGDSSKKNPVSDAGLAHLAALPSLEELHIGGGGIGDVGMEHLAKLKNLQTLGLRGTPGLTNAGLAHIGTLKSLTRLDLSGGKDVTIGGLSHLNGLTELRDLNVSGVKRDGEVLDISGLKHLERLTIGGGRNPVVADEDLACLRDLTRLEAIQIGPHRLLSDKGLAHLAGLTNLNMLNVGGPYITDDGLRHLAKLENLYHLRLTGNFGDDGLRHLGSLRRLNYLSLVSGQNISRGAQQRLRSRLPRLLSLVANQDREIRWDVMPPKAGDPAPPLRVKTLDGKQIDLSDLRGKAVLLHFWGTWCRPCVASTPALKEFHKYLSRHKDFAMISLSMDDYEEALNKHLAEHKLPWPQVRIGLKSKISARYGVNDRAPIFILVGPDGRILLQDERDWKKIAAVVDETLGEPAADGTAGPTKDLRAAETVGPEPGNGRASAVRLPNLDNGGEGGVLDLTRGERVDAVATNVRELEKQEEGDLASRFSGGDCALVCLRGAALRHWSNGRLTSAAPDARRGPVSVYFLKSVPCQCRVTTAGGDEYEIRILAADEAGARIEYWKSDGRTTLETPGEKQPAWEKSAEPKPAGNPAPEPPPTGRVLHFPKDRSMGRLHVSDASVERPISSYHYWVRGIDWQYIGEAQGDVEVPGGMRVRLITGNDALRDFSPLAKLRPDDLYELMLSYGGPDGDRITDEAMVDIRHLTGLKVLQMQYTKITEIGMKFVPELKSLEYLTPPAEITARGLDYVAELPSLKGLYISGAVTMTGVRDNRLSNSALAKIATLKGLEELALGGRRIDDGALAHLAKLPNLKYLFIRGENFDGSGFRYLRNVPSLRELVSFRIPTITNDSLQYLTDLPNLERLFFYDNGRISDAGVAHLRPMKRLKMLNLGRTQVTEDGLADLKEIKTLEHLQVPTKDLTDRGLGYLSELPNLRELRISMPHSVNPDSVKLFYTDRGLESLSKLEHLESLNIGSLGITDEGMDHVVKMKGLKRVLLFGCDNMTDAGLGKLTALTGLEELVVMGTPITVAGLSQLKALPNLKTLDCRQIKRGDGPLDLAGMTQLEKLCVFVGRKSTIGDEDLAGIKDLTNLYWLQLGPGDFTDAGVAYLAEMTWIQRLSIAGGKGLTDEGLKYLKNMKRLDHLMVSGRIGDEGLRHLADRQALGYLNIQSSLNITETAKRTLQRSLPNLHILQVGPIR